MTSPYFSSFANLSCFYYVHILLKWCEAYYKWGLLKAKHPYYSAIKTCIILPRFIGSGCMCTCVVPLHMYELFESCVGILTLQIFDDFNNGFAAE